MSSSPSETISDFDSSFVHARDQSKATMEVWARTECTKLELMRLWLSLREQFHKAGVDGDTAQERVLCFACYGVETLMEAVYYNSDAD